MLSDRAPDTYTAIRGQVASFGPVLVQEKWVFLLPKEWMGQKCQCALPCK